MFHGVRNGAELIKDSTRVLRLHPQLFVPLLFCWLVYAPLLIYLMFFLPWKQLQRAKDITRMEPKQTAIASAVFTVSCLVLLEVIQQIETQVAASEGRPVPALQDVRRPSVLDEVPELITDTTRKAGHAA